MRKDVGWIVLHLFVAHLPGLLASLAPAWPTSQPTLQLKKQQQQEQYEKNVLTNLEAANFRNNKNFNKL